LPSGRNERNGGKVRDVCHSECPRTGRKVLGRGGSFGSVQLPLNSLSIARGRPGCGKWTVANSVLGRRGEKERRGGREEQTWETRKRATANKSGQRGRWGAARDATAAERGSGQEQKKGRRGAGVKSIKFPYMKKNTEGEVEFRVSLFPVENYKGGLKP